ncbi:MULTISPECIES: M24 family metallopeptidase [Agrobacterium]|uniref:Xaa-Pro peptidase family protein n=1 Tax=Agrobacterium tumefaciens TaxID=358 RepID=A0AAF0KG48_AGRTU|nr:MULTISPECIES: Xaa-Pro peptidase family protein [Agrobacterium]WGM61211.1 Xaa-Pro peptidase family protein [Agrobacterium tumefaciens]CVI63194.1 Proline dipeptidase [Agrobacterium salinitolerans str. Hayward 0363]
MADFQETLKRFQPIAVSSIAEDELRLRLRGLQARMIQQNIKAVWLDASSSLTYYTGLSLGLSERIHGALVPAEGAPVYVSPTFEEPKLQTLIRIPGEVAVWEEDESPFDLMARRIGALTCPGHLVAIDPATPFVFASALMQRLEGRIISAQPMIVAQRQVKSAAEIAIIQTAMDASYRVQKAVFEGLRPGVSTTEVADFVNAAHIALGLKPLFVAVQFGEATAYPHGVPHAQTLSEGDMVLVDLGGILHGYRSDITRTYVFGKPTERQRFLWNAERDAQAAAFAAAQVGAACSDVDKAARDSLKAAGFGPDYQLPGLPHRTGHGLGLDIHEEPYIVAGNATALEPGMCFSIEPMLCVYSECGVRLEDIAYMTEAGPRWFCPPEKNLDRLFQPVAG